MKKLLWIVMLTLFVVPAVVKAQSAFDGFWIMDLTKAQLPTKATTYLLQNGVWHWDICRPPLDIKTDGQDYTIHSGDACREIASVNVIDDRTVVVTFKEKGRIRGTIKVTVSPDGNTLTLQDVNACIVEGINALSTKSEPQSSTLEETRLAGGPKGSHAISGSWRITEAGGQEYEMIEGLNIKGDTITRSCLRMPLELPCYSFTAKLDGTYTKVARDPKHSLVAVTREGTNTLLETWKRKRKVIEIDRMTVGPAGQSMIITSTDPRHGTTERVIARKFTLRR